jgi:hypothetical protein
MEKLFYELKPILCVWLGFVAFQAQTMLRLGRIPATALIICGLIMLFWRADYRGFIDSRRRSRTRRF